MTAPVARTRQEAVAKLADPTYGALGYHDDRGRFVRLRHYVCQQNGAPGVCDMGNIVPHRFEMLWAAEAPPPWCDRHGPMVTA